ncbi:hypothetical protein ACSBR2_031346 [Camellia fascicularis]
MQRHKNGKNNFLETRHRSYRTPATKNQSERIFPAVVTIPNRWDLVWFGMGVVIGAGIFVLIGLEAKTVAGPAVVLSYVTMPLNTSQPPSEHHCVANFLCFTSLVGVVSLVGE